MPSATASSIDSRRTAPLCGWAAAWAVACCSAIENWDCPFCAETDTEIAATTAAITAIRARRIMWCRRIADGSIRKQRFRVLF